MNQIEFKTSMLDSSLCDQSDVYILVTGTIKVAALVVGGGNNDIKVVFNNFAPFTNWISKISNTPIDNTKDIGLVISIYSLIE